MDAVTSDFRTSDLGINTALGLGGLGQKCLSGDISVALQGTTNGIGSYPISTSRLLLETKHPEPRLECDADISISLPRGMSLLRATCGLKFL